MVFVTYEKLNSDIVDNLTKIPRDIDLIVGIPRSGMLVANMIALYLNKPFVDIDSYLEHRLFSVGSTKNSNDIIQNYSDIKKILIVEDSIDAGSSIKRAKEKLIISEHEAVYLAAYVRSGKEKLVDIYFRTIDDTRIFEWNYMHNKLLEVSCLDIDGVLCSDPTIEENDDGEKYRNFLLHAKPKLLPTRKVGYLVTSRLEKYRDLTEQWLNENGVEYKELIMMKLDSAEERRKLGNYGIFKANVYKNIKKSILFIESQACQAEEIARISGKCVFCVENQKIVEESTLVAKTNAAKRIVKFKIKKIIKNVMPNVVLDLFNKKKH